MAFIGLIPLLWALRGARPARGLALGAIFGVAFFGATLYWIWLFGLMAWSGLVLMSTAFTTLIGWGVCVLRRPGRPILGAFVIASIWVSIEWLRSMVPLGGFTWGTLGVSQVENRYTLRLASITGIAGVTFVVVAVNGLLLEALAGGGGVRRRLARAGVAASLIWAPVLTAFPTARGRAIDVATIQVDVRLARDRPSLSEDRAVAGLNVEQHLKLIADPPDLAIWGEGSLDPGATSDPATLESVREAIAAVGSPTLVGAVTTDAAGDQRTEALLFDGSGETVARYAKVHLVPFGEYVPWRDSLSWIEALKQIPVDRVPGEQITTMPPLEGLPRFGTPICFENGFPEIDREMVNQGAEFLAITTNDASYGLTAASAQQLQMTQARAVEDGRWIVHSAVSGISAFVDPSGRVVSSVGLFQPDILRATIRSSSELTPYVRLGEWVPRLALLFLAGLWLAPRRGRSPARAFPALADQPRTLVLLPTYDERETIEWVIERLLDLSQGVDILVVDDSSPDGTAELVRQESLRNDRVRLKVRASKSGLASAYMDGFAVAIAEGYDLVVEMDSDLSHDPQDLPGLLEAVRTSEMALGSRYVHGGSVANWSRARVALSRAGNRYARFMLSIPVRDATSGFRVYRRSLLKELIDRPVAADGYGFQIELVHRACRLGVDVVEVPITFREREHGTSKISRTIVVEALWKVTLWGVADRLRGTH